MKGRLPRTVDDQVLEYSPVRRVAFTDKQQNTVLGGRQTWLIRWAFTDIWYSFTFHE